MQLNLTRLKKLINLAQHESTEDPEAISAFRQATKLLIKSGFTWDVVLNNPKLTMNRTSMFQNFEMDLQNHRDEAFQRAQTQSDSFFGRGFKYDRDLLKKQLEELALVRIKMPAISFARVTSIAFLFEDNRITKVDVETIKTLHHMYVESQL